MISWEVSADPQTQFSGLSSYSDVRPSNPGFAASITVTNTGATTISSMWSRSHTISDRISFGAAIGGNTLLVLGTTNSTSTATNSDGVTTGSTETILSTIGISTSTVSNRAYTYTYRKTGTQTTATTVYTTASAGTAKTTAQTAAQQTVTTTTGLATETGTSSCLSTTTSGQIAATPIAATVYVAEDGEVIWTANNTAATDLDALAAASFVGGSTTRATVYPYAHIVEALQANTTETAEVTRSEISASFTYASSRLVSYSRNEIDDTNELPHQNLAVNTFSRGISATNTAFTIATEDTITVAKSTLTETLCAISSTTARAFLNGASYRTSTSISQVYTRLTAPVTEESSTFSETDEVVANVNNDTDQPYTWTASYKSTTSNSLTTTTERQGVTTTAAFASTSYEAKHGVVGVAGGLALGYSIAADLGQASSAMLPLLVPVSRGASSLAPAAFTFASESASATFSSLSATLSFTDNSSTTLAVSPFGSPLPFYDGPSGFASAANPASLGQSETLYFIVPRGVYWSGSGSFSTTGATTSATRGEGASSGAPQSMTFFVGQSQLATATPLLWTVPRNSHPSSSILTVANAYSAP